jgi:hypothetical protein
MSLIEVEWWCEIAERVPVFARCDREVFIRFRGRNADLVTQGEEKQ